MQSAALRRKSWRQVSLAVIRRLGPLLFLLFGCAWLLSLRWGVRLALHVPNRTGHRVAWTQRYLELAGGLLQYSRYTGVPSEAAKLASIRLGCDTWRIPRPIPGRTGGFAPPKVSSPWEVRWSRPGEPPFVVIPLWIPVGTFGLASLPALISVIRALRRFKQGQCPSCGYDLTGLVPGDRCPECGKPVEAATVKDGA
jgi:hypothetical protein